MPFFYPHRSSARGGGGDWYILRKSQLGALLAGGFEGHRQREIVAAQIACWPLGQSTTDGRGIFGVCGNRRKTHLAGCLTQGMQMRLIAKAGLAALAVATLLSGICTPANATRILSHASGCVAVMRSYHSGFLPLPTHMAGSRWFDGTEQASPQE